MILHAGSVQGWVPNSLYLSSKHIKDSKADSHDEMNGEIFENWFQNTLIKNLPPNERCVIVIDNASYHSRLKKKVPNMASKKDEIIKFMHDNNLQVPSPVPIKSILIQHIREANIKLEYIVDSIAKENGHEVLRLPPYHCCLNPIELIWANLKKQLRKRNITPSLSGSVCSAIRDCVDLIDRNLWLKCVEM